ncbi:MAG: threonine synthase, partial [Candidatus Sulfotelmatobacter sp.]
MPQSSPSTPGVRAVDFRFRCIACRSLSDKASQNFRCQQCADLLEIIYPCWKESYSDAVELKAAWHGRRLSSKAVDQSGVWRFRDLLPAVEDEQAITLHEGNTPLYTLPQCSRITGVKRLFGKHQGMNPTGS